jgi:hypothetical protein
MVIHDLRYGLVVTAAGDDQQQEEGDQKDA